MSSSCFNYCVPSAPNREALGALPSDCDNREGQPVASQRMGGEIPLTTQTKHRACPAQRKSLFLLLLKLALSRPPKKAEEHSC